MSCEIKVPHMGESITEATISALLQVDGAEVCADQEIAELETDKVNQVIYAPQAGVLKWSVSKGALVKIGETIGRIQPKEGENVLTQPSSSKGHEKEGPFLRITKEQFIERLLQPKIKNKKICFDPSFVREESALASSVEPLVAPTLEKEAGNQTRKKMSPLRKVLSQRLVSAQQTMAILTTFNEVDVTALQKLRQETQEEILKKYGVKLGIASFFAHAVAAALQEFPNLNAFIEEDEIVYRHDCAIGIAIGSDKGLVVPVLRGCNNFSIGELETQIEACVERANKGVLTLEELQGGGFTISNGGIYGSLLSTPIINPPQSAILGLHKIEKRAVVVEDEIVIRSRMYVALSYDHRLIDGKEAIQFLNKIKEKIEYISKLSLGI